MKILIVSFSTWEIDGRTRELQKLSSKLGNTKVICRSINREKKIHNNDFIFVSQNDFFSLFKIAYLVLKVYKSLTPEVVIFDNRISSLIYFIFKRKFRHSSIIYDCRELYISNEVKSLKAKIGCFFERKMIKNSDLILCANEERKNIMYDKFEMKKPPIVFNNIRKLDYLIKKVESNKFKEIKAEKKTVLITSNGTSFERLTDKLIYDIVDELNDIVIVIAGKININEQQILDKYAIKNKSIKIYYVGSISQEELSSLISISDIGVVSYKQNTLNTKYCASGKIYEFIYQNLPVITTTNPPLKKLCTNYGIGESNDNFAFSTKKIINNYDFYKKKIELYINELNTSNFLVKTENEVRRSLNELHKNR